MNRYCSNCGKLVFTGLGPLRAQDILPHANCVRQFTNDSVESRDTAPFFRKPTEPAYVRLRYASDTPPMRITA